ncbi:olfactory receptor 5V1-like [Lissotriton helveticus]
MNFSRRRDFILLGISTHPEHQIPLFVVFLLLYLLNVLANMLMIVTITLHSRLHSPMYYLLRNLSFIDVCVTTTTVPKMLMGFLSKVNTISHIGCAVQLYSFIALVGAECLLLAVMAVDRYVAVCRPLHYTVIMNRRAMFLLVAICWAVALCNSLLHTAFTFRLSYCRSTLINHFFCDIPPLLLISCSDTHINEVVTYTAGGVIIIGSLVFILLSYVFIILAILRIQTSDGRMKAFSTCLSHLTVVSLFFGPGGFNYIRPTSVYLLNKDRVVSTIYAVVTPTLNPLIYSLRNKEVLGLLKKNKHAM